MRVLFSGAAMLACMAVLVAPSAAYTSGGKPCVRDIECGIPPANLQSQRTSSVSISGSCKNGRCECFNGFACEACNGRVINDSTNRSFVAPPAGTIDMCSVQYGGGLCSRDEECFHGLCIDGQCICYVGWTCAYCTLSDVDDILTHGTCGGYYTGGGKCTAASDCNNGVCSAGSCQCSSGYSCDTCTYSRADIVSGAQECACTPDQCSGHGTCTSGVCACDGNWLGADCSIDSCLGVTCSGHGTCAKGKCACTTGYGGEDCSVGGGGCTDNSECGVWAPIPGGIDNFHCTNGFNCVDGKYGGTCNQATGMCECNNGFTCPQCTAKGWFECSEAIGGATCVTADDCGPLGGSSHGICFEGRCICFDGFVCPTCAYSGAPPEGEKCPVPDLRNRRGGKPCTANADCGVFASGTGGSCTNGFCKCFAGYHCPDCSTHVAEGETLKECKAPHIGTDCSLNSECSGHGSCTGGKCVCNGGWTCDYCQTKELVVGTPIPGACEVDTDCGVPGGLTGGSCREGICSCYPGFLCSNCSVTQNSGDSCPASDFVQDGDKVKCAQRTGGKQCTEACGPQGDGTFGGSCSFGACKCWAGFTCADCSMTETAIDNGAECPSGAIRAGLSGAALVALAVAVAALVQQD